MALTIVSAVAQRLNSVIHFKDVTNGAVHVLDDHNGKAVIIDQVTIRAILNRIDALACESLDDTTVRVPAWDLVTAIEDRFQPLHSAIPNRCAGAPRRDKAMIDRLRRHALELAATGAKSTVSLSVPSAISGWIRLRARRINREMSDLYSRPMF